MSAVRRANKTARDIPLPSEESVLVPPEGTRIATDSMATSVVDVASDRWPLLALTATGDGIAVARALLRVLVRRALACEGVFTAGDSCDAATERETIALAGTVDMQRGSNGHGD